MAATDPFVARRGRMLKNLALTALLSGFALELGGAIAGLPVVFKAGLLLFLLGIPLSALGWYVGRRR